LPVRSASRAARPSCKPCRNRTPFGLELHSRAGDRTYTRTLPLSGPLLGPQGIAALSRSALTPGGAATSYLTVAPDGGSVTRFTRRLLAAATLDGQPAALRRGIVRL
jgi:hypothetical protein